MVLLRVFIDLQGAKAIAEALVSNRALVKLDLRENGIDSVGARALHQELSLRTIFRFLAQLLLCIVHSRLAAALRFALPGWACYAG